MQIEYDREVPLGKGEYGSVFPGKYRGRKVAVIRVQLHLVSDIEEKSLQLKFKSKAEYRYCPETFIQSLESVKYLLDI